MSVPTIPPSASAAGAGDATPVNPDESVSRVSVAVQDRGLPLPPARDAVRDLHIHLPQSPLGAYDSPLGRTPEGFVDPDEAEPCQSPLGANDAPLCQTPKGFDNEVTPLGRSACRLVVDLDEPCQSPLCAYDSPLGRTPEGFDHEVAPHERSACRFEAGPPPISPRHLIDSNAPKYNNMRARLLDHWMSTRGYNLDRHPGVPLPFVEGMPADLADRDQNFQNFLNHLIANGTYRPDAQLKADLEAKGYTFDPEILRRGYRPDQSFIDNLLKRGYGNENLELLISQLNLD